MGKSSLVVALTLLLVCGFVSSAPSISSPPAKIVTGFFSNVVSLLMKWVWSFKPTTKIANSARPMMKFESGYIVETVFDGSKLGIEPYSVEVMPGGELLILDSENSNIYKMSASLSLYSRPRLIAGSPEGYPGHVDGRPRESRMNHPKGLTVDDKGNIYIADTLNMAIRKISDAGVTTIAGGRAHGGGGHVDGPSEDAKFSNDFDVVYMGSSCSLLVIDRGNQAIREIQLRFDDCAYQYGSGFPLGIAVLIAAGFFGYMLALLQRRVGTMVSSSLVDERYMSNQASQYQKPLKSVRPPLIPIGDEVEKQEEGFLGSVGKLFMDAGASLAEIMGGVFPGFRKKDELSYPYQTPSQQKQNNASPAQDSYEIVDEDAPPAIETRTPTPMKTYPFMTEDAQRLQHQIRRSGARALYNTWDSAEPQHPQQPPQPPQSQNRPVQQQHHRHHRQQSSPSEAFFEKTGEAVPGTVREQDGWREGVAMRAMGHGPRDVRSRMHSVDYSNGEWRPSMMQHKEMGGI